MKKIISILCMILITGLLCSCKSESTENAAATVNGEKILKSTIENEVKWREISRKNAIDFIENGDAFTEEQKKAELEKWSNPVSYDDVLNEKIEYTVLYQEALKNKFEVDRKEIRKEAEKSFNLIFDIKESDKDYQYMKDVKNYVDSYMKENKFSKEDYIKKTAEILEKSFLIGKLKEKKQEEYMSSNHKETFEEYFNNYKQELVKKSKIKIMN